MPSGYYPKKRQSIEGQVFGLLTAIRHDHVRQTPCGSKRYFWIFRCICGNEKAIDSGDVKRKQTKSCGCKRLAFQLQSRLYHPTPQRVALHNKFLLSKNDAKARGHLWDLSWEQFVSLISSPCQNCGTPPSQIHKIKSKNSLLGYSCVYTGIDRIDNLRGYSADNVRPFCITCNMAKHTLTEEKFQAWVARLVEFRTAQKEGNFASL